MNIFRCYSHGKNRYAEVLFFIALVFLFRAAGILSGWIGGSSIRAPFKLVAGSLDGE